MTWKKTLIRNLPLIVSVCDVILSGTGCFTTGTWNYLGKTETYFVNESARYEYSPDGAELTFSGKQKTKLYCWPLIHCLDSNRGYSKYTWNTYKRMGKRVPLDSFTEERWRQPSVPFREKLVRFHLTVMPDPSAKRAWTEDDSTPVFEVPLERVAGENTSGPNGLYDNWYQRYVTQGETFRLHVNPEDLSLLSGSRNIFLTFRRRPDQEVPPSVSGADDTPVPEEEPRFFNRLLVCPYAQDGNRYEMLAYGDVDYRDESFWKNSMDRGSTGILGYCWKVLWMPPAVVADILALPVYAVNGFRIDAP